MDLKFPQKHVIIKCVCMYIFMYMFPMFEYASMYINLSICTYVYREINSYCLWNYLVILKLYTIHNLI